MKINFEKKLKFLFMRKIVHKVKYCYDPFPKLSYQMVPLISHLCNFSISFQKENGVNLTLLYKPEDSLM